MITTRHPSLDLNRSPSPIPIPSRDLGLSSLKQAERQVGQVQAHTQARISIAETKQALRVRSNTLGRSEVLSRPLTRRYGISSPSTLHLRLELPAHSMLSRRTTTGAFYSSDSFACSNILARSNRPCSFIAICNILILREQIEILPRGRKSVSYEFLAQLVGEHILLTAPDVGVSAALSMMPLTTSESYLSSA